MPFGAFFFLSSVYFGTSNLCVVIDAQLKNWGGDCLFGELLRKIKREFFQCVWDAIAG